VIGDSEVASKRRGLWRRAVHPRRWLSISVSIKPREFDGAALLAFEAAERGWGVILSRKHLQEPGAPRCVLLEKALSPGRREDIEALKGAGHELTALCEEGLIYSSVDEYGRRRLDQASFDSLRHFFSWGAHHTRDLVQVLGCDPTKIIDVGNPRFDLHRPELRGIFQPKVDAIRRRYGRYILVTTKFSKYNSISDDFEDKVAAARRAGRVVTPQHETEMRGLREFHRAGFERFAELVHKLSENHPQHQIIIRPHPSENHDRWKARVSGLPNVNVIFKGNVIEWILASDIAVHNNCTTGVEAYLLDKPTISFRPAVDDRFDMFLPNALSSQTFSVAETCQLVAKALQGENITDSGAASRRATTAKDFIANADGKLSIERIMDVIGSVQIPEVVLCVQRRWLGDFVSAQRKIRIQLHGKLQMGSRGERRRFQTQKFEGLYRRELLQRLRDVQLVTGRFKDLKVEKIEENILCVHQ
jgi:surface carbohydrate biosynthesis protein